MEGFLRRYLAPLTLQNVVISFFSGLTARD
jgi:hypothetical protein